MKLIAGLDGGNTKTLAVVCDLDGRARGIGRGGCGNWEGIGEPDAAQTIVEVVDEALAMAGAERDNLVHCHMGLAGIDWPDDEPRMREALAAAGIECGLTLENDSFLAIRACAPEGYGVGVNAGTGVAAGIITADGEKYFYGAFVDMGGGRDIDSQVVHAVIRAHDGRGRQTALTDGVLSVTGHETVPELVYDMHRRGEQIPYGAVRPILFGAAREGDAAAVEIVTRFAGELALCATNLIGRYRLAEEEPAVVAAGTLFTKTGPLLWEAFSREMKATVSRARLVLADLPPVMGGVRGALAACDSDRPEAWAEVRRSTAERGWFGEQGERRKGD